MFIVDWFKCSEAGIHGGRRRRPWACGVGLRLARGSLETKRKRWPMSMGRPNRCQCEGVSVAIRTWSACGACPPTRESWDYGVRAGEKARGKWSGRVPGVSGAASPRGGRSRTSYRSRYNYRHRYRYRRGIAASRAFRGCMQNKNLDKHHAKTHRNHREHRMLTTVGLGSSTCPPTRERTSVACFRDDVRCDAARVLGLRRPRIAFGACGRDGALVAGTSVHGSSLVSWAAVVDVRFASPPTRDSWDWGHRVSIDEDVRALASSSADV